MGDYSLQKVKSRPAAVGDKLVTHNFGSGTRGFAAQKGRIWRFTFCQAPKLPFRTGFSSRAAASSVGQSDA